MASVIAVAKSANAKLGGCACTYAPIAETCPDRCAMKGAGCYAQKGRVRMHEQRIAAPDTETAERAEAQAIDALPATDPLRLHVSGDTRTRRGARRIAAAARRYAAKHGAPVSSYTHAWQTIPAALWRGVSMLASVDSLQDGRKALRAGYAPAAVVDTMPAGPNSSAAGVRWIHCRHQTEGVTCRDCALCFKGDRLRAAGCGILFERH